MILNSLTRLKFHEPVLHDDALVMEDSGGDSVHTSPRHQHWIAALHDAVTTATQPGVTAGELGHATAGELSGYYEVQTVTASSGYGEVSYTDVNTVTDAQVCGLII